MPQSMRRDMFLEADYSRCVAPGFRPSLDTLYNFNINQDINPFRLTQWVVQFGKLDHHL